MAKKNFKFTLLLAVATIGLLYQTSVQALTLPEANINIQSNKINKNILQFILLAGCII